MARWPAVPGGGPKSMRSGIYWTRAHLQEERYRGGRRSRDSLTDYGTGLNARGAANDMRLKRVWDLHDSGKNDWHFAMSDTEAERLHELLQEMDNIAKQVNASEPVLFKGLRVPLWQARWVPESERTTLNAEGYLIEVMATAKKRFAPIKEALEKTNQAERIIARPFPWLSDNSFEVPDAYDAELQSLDRKFKDVSAEYQHKLHLLGSQNFWSEVAEIFLERFRLLLKALKVERRIKEYRVDSVSGEIWIDGVRVASVPKRLED